MLTSLFLIILVASSIAQDTIWVETTYQKNARQKYEQIQKVYEDQAESLKNALTEPMVSLIANENWVEFTLRYIVIYNKRRSTKSQIFSRILKAVDVTNGEVKFASATPEFKLNINKET